MQARAFERYIPLTPEMKSEQKWIEQFGDEDLNWNKIYTNRLQATKDIRLQNCQYKCLMRIIPTYKYLLKCKIGRQLYANSVQWK